MINARNLLSAILLLAVTGLPVYGRSSSSVSAAAADTTIGYSSDTVFKASGDTVVKHRYLTRIKKTGDTVVRRNNFFRRFYHYFESANEDKTLTKKFDFIVVNYANGDMVGHTGIYEAIEKAVKAIDDCVKDTVEAAKANDYEVIIIADHGNADHALNEDGTPNTAHSLNPVPFVYVTANKDAKVENGVLADVAPSILHILGMKQPAEMTGKDLIK